MPETADDQMLAAIHNAAASLHLQVVPEQVCHHHYLSASLTLLHHSISQVTLHSLGPLCKLAIASLFGMADGIFFPRCLSCQMKQLSTSTLHQLTLKTCVG